MDIAQHGLSFWWCCGYPHELTDSGCGSPRGLKGMCGALGLTFPARCPAGETSPVKGMDARATARTT